MGDTKGTAKPTEAQIDELIEAARDMLREHDAMGQRTKTAEALRAALVVVASASKPVAIDRAADMLDADQIDSIQQALLIGLQLYGDFTERLGALKHLQASGVDYPQQLVPIDPTGRTDTVTLFADALRMIDSARNAA